MTRLFFASLAAAAFLIASPDMPAASERAMFRVAIDHARLIRLDRDAAQIIIGNPAFADVAAQNARLLIVTGKSYGTTNLIVLDTDGKDIFSTHISVLAEPESVVTLYNGTVKRSYHCAPDCQRTLSVGDDKSQFDDLAQSVERKFGVVNSVIGGK